MFAHMRKLREPFGKKSPVQEGDVAASEKLDEGVVEVGDTLVTKVTSLEELVNKRTRDLEEAKEQLKQLSSNAQSLHEAKDEDEDEAKVEELFTQPHQPEGELSGQPGEEPADEEKDLNALLQKADGEETGQKNEQENKQENEGESDSLSSLFSQEEEVENPLAGLITSLPDVTVKELLDEAQEIKVMMSAMATELGEVHSTL